MSQQSFLHWFVSALGPKYLVLLPLAALIAFAVILVLVVRGRGWAAGAAAVLAVFMPLLVGLLGTIEGLILSYMVIASSDVTPKPSLIAEGISTSLVTAYAGLILTAPGFLLAVVGLFVRSLLEPKGK